MTRAKKMIGKKTGRGPMTKAHREAISQAMKARWVTRHLYQRPENEGSIVQAPVFQPPRSINRVLIDLSTATDKLRELYEELNQLTGRS